MLVDGDRGAVGLLAKTSVTGLELREIELPPPAPPTPDPSSTAVTDARSLYAKGDFDACRAKLETLDIAALLAAHERATVARVLLLDMACAWGALDKAAAHATAQRLASYALELPDIAVSPDVERELGAAMTAAGNAPRVSLKVSGELGARLSLDGREAGCALPCTLDVAPGDHELSVEADGFHPASRTVRVPDVTQVAITQQPATADLSARQWRARIGRGLPAVDAIGAALIGKLARESRVAYVHAGPKLTGALVVDGKVVANATGERGSGPGLVSDLAYDGYLLPRPALWQKPLFWIVTGVGALLVAGTVVAVTYEPEKRTRLMVP